MKHIVTALSETTLVLPDEAGMRLDRFMAHKHPRYSRTFFQELIEQGKITVNGKVMSKSSVSLKEDDVITIAAAQKASTDTMMVQVVPPAGVTVVHEHPHFLVVEKAAGLLVHPPHRNSTEPTVVDWLMACYPDIETVGSYERPGIIHRLDKNTSGLLIIPRTPYAFMVFGTLFRTRAIQKIYHAIVEGHPCAQGTVDLPIGRSVTNPSQMEAYEYVSQACGRKVRASTTHYTVIQRFESASLLELKPVTGRTHQLRVHMKAVGHPLIGDATYGCLSSSIDRHALHASSLSFEFEETLYHFTSPLPQDIQNLIATLQ